MPHNNDPFDPVNERLTTAWRLIGSAGALSASTMHTLQLEGEDLTQPNLNEAVEELAEALMLLQQVLDRVDPTTSSVEPLAAFMHKVHEQDYEAVVLSTKTLHKLREILRPMLQERDLPIPDDLPDDINLSQPSLWATLNTAYWKEEGEPLSVGLILRTLSQLLRLISGGR